MEFISADELLKQPKEVQEMFVDWWKPSVGDLYCNLYNGQQNNILVVNNVQLELFKTFSDDIKKYGVVLLTESHLRRFIEDKTNGKIESYYAWDYYTIAIRNTSCGGDDPQYDTEETDILQAYWKVALEVAKESI